MLSRGTFEENAQCLLKVPVREMMTCSASRDENMNPLGVFLVHVVWSLDLDIGQTV